jgi:hypothetical protein
LSKQKEKGGASTGLLARLTRLYDARRVVLPPMGERPLPSIAIALLLTCSLMTILLSLAWVQKSDLDYLRGSVGVMMLDDLQWQLRMPGAESRISTLADLGKTSVTELAGNSFQIETVIWTGTMEEFMATAANANVVLRLPDIGFKKMLVEANWLPPRTLQQGEAATMIFNRATTENLGPYRIILTVWPHDTQERIIRSTVNQTPAFLAVQSRYQKYEDFLSAKRTGSGKQLADIGRIVLAVFSVLLFIFIDSSAECLALGIFMSLKALGVAVSQGWLPDQLLSVEMMNVSRNFLLSFADVMQLYFFTQLARLWRPRPFHWMAAGIVFGAAYAYGCSISPVPGGINWPQQIWKWRNIGIGISCLACALPVALICWRARLNHRTAALLVASSGVMSQVISPFIVGIPGVTESLWYKTWYNLFETHTPFVFALSTFINVSTLERRVKTLSRAVIRKEAIERELTLGKAVQEAFFQIPELPAGIRIAYSHGAAEYVSGDTLFSHWDKSTDTVAMVLCDVTGHGVQAALKASICSALCSSIWEHGQHRPGDDPAQRLRILHSRVTSYLTKTSGSGEVLAMVGCELDFTQKEFRLFRANGVFPVIVAKTNNRWIPRVLPLHSGEMQRLPIDGPCFVVLFSDGVVDGPRTMRRLFAHMAERMQQAQESNLEATTLRDLVLSFEGFVETNDDKTLAVIELDAEAALRCRSQTAA